jgi:tetratricopeptide (TPR) repeat protein
MSLASYKWTVFWPGLAQLWLRGEGAGFLKALLFGIFVNLLLITTFAWPHLLGSANTTQVFNVLGWLVVLCFWGVSVVSTWRRLPRLLPGADSRGDDALLSQAQHAYLKGNWYDTEKILLRLLEDSPRDADAHLFLATLYRRTRRYEEAEQHLQLLERLQGGGKWLFEIDEERRLLAQNREQADDEEKEAVVSTNHA